MYQQNQQKRHQLHTCCTYPTLQGLTPTRQRSARHASPPQRSCIPACVQQAGVLGRAGQSDRPDNCFWYITRNHLNGYHISFLISVSSSSMSNIYLSPRNVTDKIPGIVKIYLKKNASFPNISLLVSCYDMQIYPNA